MRLADLTLADFKGCEVSLPWERVNVLFGPNDGGKTNLLEAVATAFGRPDLARPPSRSERRVLKVSALFELEEDDRDDELLAALLQRDHVPPIFPLARRRYGSHGGALEPATPVVSPARLRWAARPSGAPSFSLMKRRGGAAPAPGTLPLDRARDEISSRARKAIGERARDAGTRADVETLLEAGLRSRWLLFDGGVLTLLCPSADECDNTVTAAAKRLARRGWRSDSVLGPLVAQLADPTGERRALLRMLDRRDIRPFEIVWIAAQGMVGRELETGLRREFDRWYEENQRAAETGREILRILRRQTVEAEILAGLQDLIDRTRTYTSPSDRWLGPAPDIASPATWVYHLARRISEDANGLGAPMVQEAGELELAVLGPRHWLGEDRRLEPRLHQPHRERPAPLREVGLGLGIWSAVAMLEAATAQRHELLQQLDEVRHGLGRIEPSREGADAPAPPRDEFGSRTRLLIVDEPEQHLHPRAQREIAAWLAAGAEERETLLATHALAFLDMPSERASYTLVTRGPDGVTRATDITDDMFESLERLSTEAGLSGRAEALQTVRLVALVEGAHDEMVLRHFYRKDLARHRVLVVPVRGAKNVNAIIDAPWLSRLGAPFIVLFDEVRSSVVEGGKRPSGRDIAAQAVWDLLRHWDEPSRRPYVASFDLPDIFRALPERCIERAAQEAGGSFPGWRQIDAAFDHERSTGFKKVVLKHSKLPMDTDLDSLLSSALETCRAKPEPALEQAVQVVIDHARMAGRPQPRRRGKP
jgi:AAA domain, putative AbiEii toxin, Type IV TA system/Overcoming lysogenization defect protein-like, TOPRIM domain